MFFVYVKDGVIVVAMGLRDPTVDCDTWYMCDPRQAYTYNPEGELVVIADFNSLYDTDYDFPLSREQFTTFLPLWMQEIQQNIENMDRNIDWLEESELPNKEQLIADYQRTKAMYEKQLQVYNDFIALG